ncbi:tRNA (adenosine(37)-N6)-dimethylallyltransferase MiaA [Agrilactobacillus fermenti]|uniref:tRNA (adenosine(37)-N6)-dimethylallyltransferase MiaA n=1 Tax=Agrilactobacillus fermenti TaxID=2586909 RepID=UPI001E5CD514|nr:tRNA (adenosine(37)-N6)-dimethylallyltransferase MiaA [Agrilactobacillus fermenti]MCD2256189.1 tRNA (adenosine(37)-N6)-dimethylallyltransferase MiaA [Agrilactobacillus fermenti]
MKPKVLMIVGPTAVGKTELSLRLAHQYNGEIISGDSMQVYRQLDIGTAKIMPAERQNIPHYLIDILDWHEGYSAYQFKKQATELIYEIQARHKLPIIVGGTGFYLNALRLNLNLGDNEQVDTAAKTRQKWRTYYDHVGAHQAWLRLKQLDPPSAKAIPETNRHRLIRALEVNEEQQQLFSQQKQPQPIFDSLVIGLNTDRGQLYQRINHRVDIMVSRGLVAEAEKLYAYRDQMPLAAKAIGYRELFRYFDGQIDLQTAIELIQRNSRHYAKRQLTYFRNQMPVHWFDPFADENWYSSINSLIDVWQK